MKAVLLRFISAVLIASLSAPAFCLKLGDVAHLRSLGLDGARLPEGRKLLSQAPAGKAQRDQEGGRTERTLVEEKKDERQKSIRNTKAKAKKAAKAKAQSAKKEKASKKSGVAKQGLKGKHRGLVKQRAEDQKGALSEGGQKTVV